MFPRRPRPNGRQLSEENILFTLLSAEMRHKSHVYFAIFLGGNRASGAVSRAF